MVLCAGLGTRLRPLTDFLAKPMVPIGDEPAVGHVVRRLRAGGIDRIVVNVHHRPEDLRDWARAEGALVSEEPELLGTAGGVARAAPQLGDGDVLVYNGDIWSDLDPRVLVAAHGAANAEATLAVVRRAAGEGNVGLDADGRVVRLRRERFGVEDSSADFIGIHVIGPGLRSRLPPMGCLVGDVYIPALRAGARLATRTVTASFVDVGSPAAYLAANRAWLERRGASSWTSASASIGASVEGSVVGEGARIEADTIRSVVWPSARVTERVENAIVTPHGTVFVTPS